MKALNKNLIHLKPRLGKPLLKADQLFGEDRIAFEDLYLQVVDLLTGGADTQAIIASPNKV